MALHALLRRGIQVTLAEHGAQLEHIAANAGLPEGAAAHLAQAIEAVPGLLVALDGLVQEGDEATRRLWVSVVSYLLLEDDHVPSEDGTRLSGVLDDAYLVHAVVERFLARVSATSRLDPRSVAGGRQLLGQTLPPRVVRALDERLDAFLRR